MRDTRRKTPDAEYLASLREHIRYEEGNLFWAKRPAGRRGNGIEVGAPVGCPAHNGYIQMSFQQTRLWAHRVTWFLCKGEWPSFDLDHINRNRADNRIENLRAANRSENNANSKLARTNKSGYKGVHWCARTRKWCMQIWFKGRRVRIVYFDCPELAGLAYDECARQLYGAFAHTNNDLREAAK